MENRAVYPLVGDLPIKTQLKTHAHIRSVKTMDWSSPWDVEGGSALFTAGRQDLVLSVNQLVIYQDPQLGWLDTPNHGRLGL